MAFPCCFSSQSQLAFKAGFLGHGPRLPCKMMAIQRLRISHTNVETELFSLQSGQIRAAAFMRTNVETELFSLQLGRIRTTAFMRPNLDRTIEYRRISTVSASCLPSTQLASSVFTLGTAAVLPFYTLMIVAPKAEVTKKVMASSLPYIALGLLYAYLLYLSWTPDTIRLMCSGKNFLPELPAIAKLFSNEMTLASAWIHLLVIDLFAARQVFHEGLQENVETRHSVSLCLFFCPIGVFTHFLTKAISKTSITKGGAGN